MKAQGTSSQSFKKASPFYEIELKKSDSYNEVIEKVCSVLKLCDERGLMSLFTARGSVICNQAITINSKQFEWTLGSYLSKRHVSPEKLCLGIGELTHNKRQNSAVESEGCEITHIEDNHNQGSKDMYVQPMKRSRVLVSDEEDLLKFPEVEQPQALEPLVGKNDDDFEVYYFTQDNVFFPLSREECWLREGGSPGKMDRYGAFNPENAVCKIVWKTGMMTRVILGYDGQSTKCLLKGKGPLLFTSCTSPQLKGPKYVVPLIVIASNSDCSYWWKDLQERDNSENCPLSSPVYFVNKPHMFECTVMCGMEKIGSQIFDVKVSDIAQHNQDIQQNSKELTYSNKTSSAATTTVMVMPEFKTLTFSVKELMESTNHLSNELGFGGFGKVYLAHNLRSNGTKAAVKVLNEAGNQALVYASPSRQIESELTALMKFRHPNVLEAMGYCFTEKFKALVYEFLENGSLFDFLHNSSNHQPSLSWTFRENILKDLLRGVAYLHAADPPLIHQDIKTQNVLIDSHYKAKVADFGFAWEAPKSTSGRTLLTAPLVARSDGYYPPELLTGKISPLSDVYSCGVVVLETFSGLKAYDQNRDEANLATFLEDHRQDAQLFASVADKNGGTIDLHNTEVYRQIVNKCLLRYSIRPKADQILDMWAKD